MTYWRCVIPDPVCVADDEAPPIQLGVGLVDGPGRREGGGPWALFGSRRVYPPLICYKSLSRQYCIARVSNSGRGFSEPSSRTGGICRAGTRR